ncbi:VOC family protein [Sphingobium abikonense]|uniref:VOC family protein n=1 Tax=Sphingobium abikonense TaxID=86193 RepID=UPI003512BC0E
MTDPDTGAFIWYELMTPDPDAAKTFYDAVIGWDIAAREESGSEMDYRMIRRSDGGHAGGVLALSRAMQDGGARPAWYGYVCVPDVNAAKSAFEAAGGTVHFDQTIEGVGRMALVADGQGAPLYVMTPTPPFDDPNAKSDVFDYRKPQHVRWNELSTADQDEAIAFYTGLFGWRQDGAMPMPGLGDYKFLYRGEDLIGAIVQKPPAMPQSNWTYSIGVDAIDRAVAAVKDGGGTLIEGLHQIPGGEFSAVCTDPHGIAFGLVGPRREK